MTEIDRIRDQLERAFKGDPWCGPSLMEVLAGTSAEQAASHVPGVTHSIWEIVLHLSGWQGAVAMRIAGQPIAMPEAKGWPTPSEPSESAWQAALQTLRDTHTTLLRTLDALDESLLDQKVGDSRDQSLGSGMTAYANLHGIAQHAMYHAGQIVILKKLTAET